MVKIFVDFNNIDSLGRVRLTSGSFDDLEKNGLELNHGLEVSLDDGDELSVPGIIEFSEQEKVWVAKFDWNKLGDGSGGNFE